MKQCCDNVAAQVQMTQHNNLKGQQAAAQSAVRRMQRPRVYLEPVEQEFLPQFQVDTFRRRLLVLDAATKLGCLLPVLQGMNARVELSFIHGDQPTRL